ncbi:hypothetical protein HYV72_00405 [Candidatus Uhrbacteria bacterium]|nr:hypothetical protein [Candidatus Uhrbacteria bacterium]
MLTYVAIVPHPPFVVPGFAHEQGPLYDPMREAMKIVGEDLHALSVDALVCLSVHGERYENALSIAYHDPYLATLRAFGTQAHDAAFLPHAPLIDGLRRGLRRADIPVTLSTNTFLDDASSVVLLTWKLFLESARVVIVTPPSGNTTLLTAMGRVIRECIEARSERVAVCAIAHLSERLSSVSPEGIHQDAAQFDERMRHAIVDQNRSTFKTLARERQAEVGAHELDAIRLLLDILDETRVVFKEHAYVPAHGIGHVVASARL